jgi:hypothetical protein
VGPIDFSIHLLSFFAPAFVVAILVALGGRVVLSHNRPPGRWWLALVLNFLTGAAVLVAGLVLFGRDGKMLTYTAMLVCIASTQWLTARAWRS